MQIIDFIAMMDNEIKEREVLILGLQRDIEMYQRVKEKCNGKASLPITSLLDTLREASVAVHGKDIFAKFIGDEDNVT